MRHAECFDHVLGRRGSRARAFERLIALGARQELIQLPMKTERGSRHAVQYGIGRRSAFHRHSQGQDMDIGFIGLGSMGSAMALNALKAGHTVRDWNRSREATK